MPKVIFTDASFDTMFFNTGIPMEEHVLGTGEFIIREATDEALCVIRDAKKNGSTLDVCINNCSDWPVGDEVKLKQHLLSDDEWDTYYIIKQHDQHFWYVKLEMR